MWEFCGVVWGFVSLCRGIAWGVVGRSLNEDFFYEGGKAEWALWGSGGVFFEGRGVDFVEVLPC